ncbi:MAG: hypothetical protein ACRC1K_14725, partial [Planctomycetia bacterium]
MTNGGADGGNERRDAQAVDREELEDGATTAVCVLERLAEAVDMALDPIAARRAYDLAKRELPADADWYALLAKAGGRVGLTLHRSFCSLRDAVALAQADAPMVLHAKGGDDAELYTVFDVRGSRVSVGYGRIGRPAEWMSKRRLMALVKVANDRDLVECASAEPSAPYQNATSAAQPTPSADVEPTAHPHGAHGGHGGHGGHGSAVAPLARLWQFLHPEWQDIRLITIYAVAIGVLMLTTPIAVESLVSFVAFGGLVSPVLV